MKRKIALISEEASLLAALGGTVVALPHMMEHLTIGVIEKIHSLEHEYGRP
jgi:hypothetical protein